MTGVSETGEGQKKIFEEIVITQTCWKLKPTDPRSLIDPKNKNIKENYTKATIAKLLEINNKEKILKAARGGKKKHFTNREIKVLADSQSETMRVGGQ